MGDMARPHDPVKGVFVTMLSDNLMAPKKWIGRIEKYPDGMCRWAVRFVGEQKSCEWVPAPSEREAKKALNAFVKDHKAKK